MILTRPAPPRRMVALRDSSLIRARSSNLSFGISGSFFPILLDDLVYLGKRNLCVQVLAHRDHGGKPTAAQAPNLLQAKMKIRRGLAGLDLKESLELLEDLHRCLYVAPRAQTDRNGVSPSGLQAEGSIE